MAVIYPPTKGTVLTWETTRQVVQWVSDNFGAYPDEMSTIQWMAAMDRHVQVVTREDSWVNTAVIDRGSEKLIASGLHEDYIAAAETACAIYNSLPEAVRSGAYTPLATLRNGGPGDGGGPVRGGGGGPISLPPPPPPPSSWVTTYIWGIRIYLDHSDCMTVAAAEGAGATIAGVVAKILSGFPLAGIICGAVTAFLTLEASWLTWADNHCGQQGAYLDQTWLNLGAPYISTVC